MAAHEIFLRSRLPKAAANLSICPVFRRLGLVFAVLAIFSIAGGQWAVIQSVAWAGMLRDYTQRTGSFAVAVGQTFDGEHPCELCREIASAKAKEQREKSAAPVAKEAAKIKAMVADAAALVLPPLPTLPVGMPAAPLFGTSRADQPPTPPPRRGAVAA